MPNPTSSFFATVVLTLALATLACAGTGTLRTTDDNDDDADTGSGTESGADGSDSLDEGTETEVTCGDCPETGDDLTALACALGICGPALVAQRYESPTGIPDLTATREALTRFGSGDNDLAPREGQAYAALATGAFLASYDDADTDYGIHNDDLGEDPGAASPDPFDADPASGHMHNAVEWTLTLAVPDWAHALAVDYIFFSAEYDEFVGSKWNDKFYIFIQEPGQPSTRQVINFTACRDPAEYQDFVCPADATSCTPGEPYCYIAVNTALSECCWAGGCDQSAPRTDIDGTHFVCAPDAATECSDLDDRGYCTSLGPVSFVSGYYGGTTGWLSTTWPVEPGASLELVFHLHDTYDAIRDSLVLVDNFRFVSDGDAGTVVIE